MPHHLMSLLTNTLMAEWEVWNINAAMIRTASKIISLVY